MAKRKEEDPIPAELLAMTLEQLNKLDEGYDSRSEGGRAERDRLLAVRDKAQADLEAFSQRRRDITSAIVKKLENNG